LLTGWNFKRNQPAQALSKYHFGGREARGKEYPENVGLDGIVGGEIKLQGESCVL